VTCDGLQTVTPGKVEAYQPKQHSKYECWSDGYYQFEMGQKFDQCERLSTSIPTISSSAAPPTTLMKITKRAK
jgi:hypothetical protein